MTGTPPKLIAIIGPTASGKTGMGVELALKHSGEIVSADSRQVFRGLDLGTGKVTPEEEKGVPHYLLDIKNPGENFSVNEFQSLAFKTIDDIIGRGKVPLLVGGTALYAYAVIDNYQFAEVAPNMALREELKNKTVEELQAILIALVGTVLNADDFRNPRRLIRAIEKIKSNTPLSPQKGPTRYGVLILGIDIPREELYQRIDKRVDDRIKQGMIEEAQKILDEWPKATRSIGEGWLIGLGLEYKWITEYLQGKYTKDEMIKRLKGAIHAFSRRQMTWFKKDKRIIWVKNLDEAAEAITTFSYS